MHAAGNCYHVRIRRFSRGATGATFPVLILNFKHNGTRHVSYIHILLMIQTVEYKSFFFLSFVVSGSTPTLNCNLVLC